MNSIKFVMGCTLVLLSFLHLASAKEWRGITPLKSNRADVERLLGRPDENIGDTLLTYYFPDMVVSIQLSAIPQCRENLPQDSWDVSTGTVTTVRVDIRNQVLLSDLPVDVNKFKVRKGASDMNGHFYLTNEDEGYTLEVSRGFVMSYIYEPELKDQKLRCCTVSNTKPSMEKRNRR